MVTYFEIPVSDLDRAEGFYSVVFEIDLVRESIDGNVMSHFPDLGLEGCILGSLSKGASYAPGDVGVRVYFRVQSIDVTLARVVTKGGQIAYPKTDTAGHGFVAEFIDSEGNRIGLSEAQANM